MIKQQQQTCVIRIGFKDSPNIRVVFLEHLTNSRDGKTSYGTPFDYIGDGRFVSKPDADPEVVTKYIIELYKLRDKHRRYVRFLCVTEE